MLCGDTVQWFEPWSHQLRPDMRNSLSKLCQTVSVEHDPPCGQYNHPYDAAVADVQQTIYFGIDNVRV